MPSPYIPYSIKDHIEKRRRNMSGKEEQLVTSYLVLRPSEFYGPLTCCSGHSFFFFLVINPSLENLFLSHMVRFWWAIHHTGLIGLIGHWSGHVTPRIIQLYTSKHGDWSRDGHVLRVKPIRIHFWNWLMDTARINDFSTVISNHGLCIICQPGVCHVECAGGIKPTKGKAVPRHGESHKTWWHHLNSWGILVRLLVIRINTLTHTHKQSIVYASIFFRVCLLIKLKKQYEKLGWKYEKLGWVSVAWNQESWLNKGKKIYDTLKLSS